MTTSERIADKLKHLPASPGVYLMKDANGDVIYVGKAVVLRNRVRSYFHSQKGLSRKTRRLVQEIADIEVIQTATESEAFILEESLIKRLQPHFNIRLRDDKRYPYLKITNEPFPRLMIVRRRKDDGARYFGPYTSSSIPLQDVNHLGWRPPLREDGTNYDKEHGDHLHGREAFSKRSPGDERRSDR